MAFHDVRFEPRLPFGVTVASQRKVDVIALASGHESRNARTAHPLRRFTIPVGARPIEEAHAILAFFEARGGPLNAFRFPDPIEHTTGSDGSPTPFDVVIGTGDGARTAFQLVTATGRAITKPEVGSVMVAVNEMPLESDQFDVDGLTGEVTLAQPPTLDAVVRAGCIFDLAVRFENPTLTITRANAQSAEMDDLSLVEVRT